MILLKQNLELSSPYKHLAFEVKTVDVCFCHLKKNFSSEKTLFLDLQIKNQNIGLFFKKQTGSYLKRLDH